MDRVAVFVDAGYLFAQGSAALAGSRKPRTSIVIDAPKAIAALKKIAGEKAPGCRLLRIYWYDGAIGGSRPTTDQAVLAHLDDVKLRLGFVNSQGEQKGVDSLIVTDLIELARLASITDAILLSGDEDIRVGVQIAQNYGVRVHLLGIIPSRASQSHQLADTTKAWPASVIATFMTVRGVSTEPAPVAVVAKQVVETTITEISQDVIAVTVDKFVAELTETEILGVAAYWEGERGVPQEFDRKLLPICGQAVGRNLEREEIRRMRSRFQQSVQLRLNS